MNESSAQIHKKEHNNLKCRFFGKPGHFHKGYLKRKAWFENKGKPSAFVCFESNFAEIPYNIWWINFDCTTHVSNMMQGSGFSSFSEAVLIELLKFGSN